MSNNDERSDSLAAQAAAWVPPWERPQRPPDRAFQAAAEEAARAEAEDHDDAARDGSGDGDDFADVTELAAADDLADEDDAALGDLGDERDAALGDLGDERDAALGDLGGGGDAALGDLGGERDAALGDLGDERDAALGDLGDEPDAAADDLVDEGGAAADDIGDVEDAAAGEGDVAADDRLDEPDAAVDEIGADESGGRDEFRAVAQVRPDDDEERSVAGLSDDDDDFDPAFEGPNPAGHLAPQRKTDKSDMSGQGESSASGDPVAGLGAGEGEFRAVVRGRPDVDEERSVAGLSDDDDDFDPAFEGPHPAGHLVRQDKTDKSDMSGREEGSASVDDPRAGLSAGRGEVGPDEDEVTAGEGEFGADEGQFGAPGVEKAAVAGGGDEPVSVDQPIDADGAEAVPSAGEVGPELSLPGPVENAAEEAGEEQLDGVPADAPLPADGDDAGDVFNAAADDDVSDDGADDLPIDEDVPGEDDGDGSSAADAGAAGETESGAADAGAAGETESGAAGAVRAGGGAESGAGGAVRAGGGAESGAAGAVRAGGGAESGAAGAVGAGGGAGGEGAAAAGGDGGGLGDQLTTQPAAGDAPGRGRGKAVPEQGRRRREEAPAVVEAGPRTSEDLPELTDDAELAAALEAILLVVDEPVGEMQLAQILEQPTERVGAMLENISARYTAAGHGFDLRRAAGGWRLYTRPEYAAYVERFVLDGQSVRLTQAALETLAVVAYKQPVTRSRISAIRGVNCDGVMRTLVTRGLIEECGTEGETGAYLYRTTALFLEKLGLNSVDQLPPLAPFLPDDVEEVLDAPG